MKTTKPAFPRRALPIVLAFFLLVSCGTGHSASDVRLSFQGEMNSFAESEKYVYIVSHVAGKDNQNATYYIYSFLKNGKKNWSVRLGFSGSIYPLRDGRFFCASKDGKISAFDEQGKTIWEKHLSLDEYSNSNYLLNSNEKLMVNIVSSPSASTVYHTISIDGEESTSSLIPDLTSCYTYNYPLGGYITEGFTENQQWFISRLNEDFSVEWTYGGGNNDSNFHIKDFSNDGRILFVGSGGENDSAFLQELDSKGNEMHRIDFKSANIFAAYFRDKIVAAADKLRILESDLTVNAEFEQLKYPRIKAFEKSFFVYSPGSYDSSASVVYDGYCKQYDESNALKLDQTFRKSDRFIEIGETGKFYYRK